MKILGLREVVGGDLLDPLPRRAILEIIISKL
jgi:hypothetical protein